MRCPLTFHGDSSTYATVACAYALGYIDRRTYELLLNALTTERLTPTVPEAPVLPLPAD